MSPITPTQRKVLQAHTSMDVATTADLQRISAVGMTTLRNQLRSLIMKKYVELIPKEQTVDKTRQHTRMTKLGREVLVYDFSKEPKVAKYGPKKSFFSDTKRPVVTYTPYRPDAMVPMRPGANDHLNYKSLGF